MLRPVISNKDQNQMPLINRNAPPLLSALACCLTLSAAMLHAQGSPSAEQQLIDADRSMLEEMTGPHPDQDKYAHALAPEYLDVEDGATHTRTEVLGWVATLTGFTFQYDSPRAVLQSPSSGYVVADVRYSYGTYIKEHKLTTTSFVLRDGRWLATLHTEMPFQYDRDAILATPADKNADVIAMRRLAADVMSQVRVPGYAPFPLFPVSFDAGAGVSFSNGTGAHEADFSTLPPPMQQLWASWASYTRDEPSGEALFKDMFYRFFLVHELGHLIAGRVMLGLPGPEEKRAEANVSVNATEKELVANRIAVAWFREHDPQYLARLVADFRLIQAQLPNPVPRGANANQYLTQNYLKLSADPLAYGWYQLNMVISVSDEPAKSFEQVLNTLPALRYTEE